MSVSAGPNNSENGLVFYYDMGNTQKSWKGKPTTNLCYNGSDTLSGTNWWAYCAGNTNNVTYNTSDIQAPDGTYTATKIIRDSGTVCGGSGAWGLIWAPNTSNVTAGNTYTISVYARSPSPITISFLMNDAGGGGNINLTNAWQRFTFTSALPTSGTGNRGLQFIMPAGSGTAYFWGAQLEENGFLTPYVSSTTTNGVRSNTQAVLDLTGNTTITASSLSYSSDGSFSFNGTSDVATIPSLNLNNMDYSVEVWFNCASINRVNGLIGDLQFDWWTFQVQSNNTLRAKHKESDVLGGPTVTGTTAISANIWYQAVMTFSTVSGMKVYLNGVLDGSTSNVQPFTLTGRGPQYIGQHRGGAASSPEVMNGKIGIVKIYKNLCLSASEVKSNFNALRSRFGI